MNTYSEDKMYESYSSEVERMRKCIDELLQENKQLKIQISAREEVCDRLESNWNKLKKYIVESNKTLCWTNNYDSILGKMEELQGSDSNE
jgi:FtsZ-binding cell division protein ZapB